MKEDPFTVQFHKEIYDLRPWYHNFEKLGLQTDFGDMKMTPYEQLQRLLLLIWPFKPTGYVEKGEKFSLRTLWQGMPRSHLINQRHKEEHLIPFIQRTLEHLGSSFRCLDLFCADGYYSCLIGQLAPNATIVGVDLDKQEITRARAAAQILNVTNATFRVENIWDTVQKPLHYDLILCAGGLYHLTKPHEFLTALTGLAKKYLVIQSVISLETEAADYFITPAPGWKHGSRFTHAALKKWLIELGWTIIAEARNELTGNPHLCDRGSSYFLCQWSKS